MGPPPPGVTSVSVSPAELQLAVGGTASLVANITATDNVTKSVTWSSEDDAVASVNASGTVTAVAVGVTTVTATSTHDPSKRGSAQVTVTTTGPEPNPDPD
ncbi:MAG: Ig-like domain-containing protein, partial [Trueperaceae bacterium]